MYRPHALVVAALLFSGFAVAEESPASGSEALYQQHCAQCHGVSLQGGNAQSMVDGIWLYGAGGGTLKKVIKHGITVAGMPAYEDTLSDEEISGLVKFIESQEKSAGAVKPAPPEELQTQDYTMKVDIVAEGLQVPWAIDFLDADTALITERPGRLRILRDGVLAPEAVAGTPVVHAEGQGGLMDVAVDPDYAENGWIYLAYSHALETEDGKTPATMTRIVRGKIVDNAWSDQEVIFEADPDHYLKSRHHYGCRIVFDPEGHLYFSIGERGFQDHAQDLGLPNGKVHRINRDGSIPEDNPFVDQDGALPSIFTYGNRNAQGLATHPDTGAIWETEHGPMGGDEVNLLHAGANYGWPEITYGRNYNGKMVTEHEALPDMEQPILYWKPSIAACGLDFHRGGDQFAKWRGHLLAGGLRFEEVKLLTVVDDRILHSETIFKNYGRVRGIGVGPDGAIYIVLNGPDIVVRLTEKAERSYE